MKTAKYLLLIACLVLPFTACKKHDAAAMAEAEDVPLSVPATDGDTEWKAYLQDVVTRNMGKITNSPFLYYLPSQSDPEFEAKYERQLDQAKLAMARGIVGGNLIAFGSPESARMADIAVASFAEVPADTMKGVRVLFIGKAEDNERVQAALTPSGVDYVFVEAK
ncbi:hypothetical protein CSC70_06435 [Pseudoxanthomonas kalamensis DSM 18571]|uniref:hypothetical protein n=1 Tax=Pseudoxanthomonas kalamensis TaxID=289483 RepID=UPI001391FC23|nr:hypothetical protein [Pseudoxanthomonas kalamensis]KAF1710325.1 hypothetical protein CSC70_06435 [Pseudoxanthomonas kalamensis DSM 18571]